MVRDECDYIYFLLYILLGVPGQCVVLYVERRKEGNEKKGKV